MDDGANPFEREAGKKEAGTLVQVLGLIRDQGKWWLLPILLVVLVLGALVVLGGTGAAPFIYTMF